MNSLAEDLEEVGADKGLRAWVARKRRDAYIARDEAACWFVFIEHGDEPPHDEWFGLSPGDALAYAAMYAANRLLPARGRGRWLLEVYGDGEGTPPEYLVVRPKPDVPQL